MALVSLNLLSRRHQILCHLSLPTYLFALGRPNTGWLPQFSFPWEPALEFSFSPSFSFMQPGQWGWSETLRAVYHDGKNTGSGVNQTWHKTLPLPLLATWPWENFFTSDNFLTSLNLSFCFCKMRLKPAHRAVMRKKRHEKWWVSNPEWGKPRRQLV